MLHDFEQKRYYGGGGATYIFWNGIKYICMYTEVYFDIWGAAGPPKGASLAQEQFLKKILGFLAQLRIVPSNDSNSIMFGSF